MDLDVIGAGPAYTDRPGATGAAYLVRDGETSLVLDLGQGSFPRLAAAIDPTAIDLIAISHLHPDHFIDLVPLRHYLRWEVQPRGGVGRLAVVAPSGLADRIDALHAEPGFTAAALDVAVLEPGARDVAGLRLEARRIRHTADSFAFRVSRAAIPDRPGLVYSGDCGAAADLEPLIRPGDDLLVEASFGLGPVPPGAEHLDAPSILDLAARAKPSRILLTHIQMGHDPAATVAAVQAGFEGPVLLAEPGVRVRLAG
ncbi:MAG TPA: MBL fold metallo-hydrolase [Candidatus Limnocylindrales bacterium]|nr:MBL fold metallo-hydrolase [Candidatus Limnocylindrales bacterium]